MATSLEQLLQDSLGDGYRVERELAPGGMSRLFLATERSLERRVVVKLLPPELVSEASAQRFQREMLVTARLQHAHILPVLSAGARNGLLYYVTPYITGESLRRHIEINGALPVHMTMRLLREVADALGFAHRHGVVHRDLKPANIFLQHGHAILADFGIARAVESATAGEVERLTRTGAGLGTPGYMSPEQLAGDANVDARADIYAVGVIAYEMLAGEPPFAGLSGPKLIVAHMIEIPQPIEALREDVPVALAGLIRRCLEKEPERRWQSVDEMMLALEDSAVIARVTDPLEEGVAAFERREWQAAFDALCAADIERPLAPRHLEQLADAAWWIGKSDDCIRTRERAYARYMESDDHIGAARVALALAEDYHHKLARAVAHGWLQAAESHLALAPESIVHGWLARLKALMALEQGRDPREALALAEEASQIARRMGDHALQALTLQDRGRILVSSGLVPEGMAAIDEATAAATSGQLDPRTTGRIFCNMMSTCESLADYRRAVEWNDAAREWCEPHSQSGFPGICRVHRAQLLRLRGSWREAEAEASSASAELDDFLSDVAAEAYYELGEIRLRMGELKSAERLFRRAHELGRDPVPGLALLRLAEGKTDRAKAMMDRALSDESKSPLDRARLLPAQAEVSIACGSTDAARAAAEELAATAEKYGSPAMAARAAFVLGMVELGEGEAARAAVTLRGAWRLLKESELPYEAARARVVLARAYSECGNGEDAELELQAAVSSFEKLGAEWEARRVEGMLER
ncbi:MAG TPA: protein kinase [Gemmatimonadaceae bacterium]|nr:protein kinase [Gemmatimonadaceae bacterium]